MEAGRWSYAGNKPSTPTLYIYTSAGRMTVDAKAVSPQTAQPNPLQKHTHQLSHPPAGLLAVQGLETQEYQTGWSLCQLPGWMLWHGLAQSLQDRYDACNPVPIQEMKYTI